MTLTAAALLAALLFKHFLADFVFQTDWMSANKHNLYSAAGYLHAGVHAGMSVPVLVLFGASLPVVAGLAVAEFVAHFLIDLIKARSRDVIEGRTSSLFWAALGADQYAHQLTYLAMVWVVLGVAA